MFPPIRSFRAIITHVCQLRADTCHAFMELGRRRGPVVCRFDIFLIHSRGNSIGIYRCHQALGRPMSGPKSVPMTWRACTHCCLRIMPRRPGLMLCSCNSNWRTWVRHLVAYQRVLCVRPSCIIQACDMCWVAHRLRHTSWLNHARESRTLCITHVRLHSRVLLHLGSDTIYWVWHTHHLVLHLRCPRHLPHAVLQRVLHGVRHHPITL